MWPIHWWKIERKGYISQNIMLNFVLGKEALESVMCDDIKIRQKKKDCNEKWERKPVDKY